MEAMTSPDKRVTKFPGNAVNIFSKFIASSESTDSTLVPQLDLKKSEPHSHQRVRPVPLPLKTHTSQQNNSTIRSKRKICQAGPPWQSYNAILTEDQNGPVTLAQKSGPDHTLMAIKEVKATQDECVNRLQHFSHPNLVSLVETFLSDNVAYMVYEWMDISVTDIQSTCCGNLASFQIAAICKEECRLLSRVLIHIDFVRSSWHWITYTKLSKYRMDLSILITSKCRESGKSSWVKLFFHGTTNYSYLTANLGESMLSKNWKADSIREDIRAVGLMMMRLMEPSTNFRNANSLELENPDKWDSAIMIFLQKTEYSTCQHLLQDSFLRTSPGGQCLAPLVFIAERSISRDWSLSMK